MNQSLREKIALVVFLVLVVLTLLGGVVYLNVGHNWNVTASSIDDAAGSLEGYTAILYDGVSISKTPLDDSTTTTPVTLSAAALSYENKKATVFELNSVTPEMYQSGSILKRGDKKIGVFCVTPQTTPLTIQSQISYFKHYHVDYIVCFSTNTTYMTAHLDGIDVLISLDSTDYSMGKTVGKTYLVSSPCVGKIGSVLISPHNVASSKDISSLQS
ncbi:MAG: hypothetical protein LKF61_01305 [Eggerthellaceae bacterium]|jgi:galactitol-specific phosphotransferase system IIB component|nr:hypothetical protein [Eggerthellaceae bacterium]MCH4221240.1 hypothetical protein [Eggerthellaceae bacterium]